MKDTQINHTCLLEYISIEAFGELLQSPITSVTIGLQSPMAGSSTPYTIAGSYMQTKTFKPEKDKKNSCNGAQQLLVSQMEPSRTEVLGDVFSGRTVVIFG